MNFDDLGITEAPWIVYIDKQKNKPYYYHPETKKTVWDEPKEFTLWKDRSIDLYLKKTTWRKATNEKGRVYYFDKNTKKTQWEAPEGVVEFESYLQLLTQKQLKSRKSSKIDFITSKDNSHGNESQSSKDISLVSLKAPLKIDSSNTSTSTVVSTLKSTIDSKQEEINVLTKKEDEEDDDFERTPEQYNDDDDDDDDNNEEEDDDEDDENENDSDEENMYGDSFIQDQDDDYDNNNNSGGDHHHYSHDSSNNSSSNRNHYLQGENNILKRYNSIESSIAFEESHPVIEGSTNIEEDIKQLESILSKRDSIMEPDVVKNTKRLRALTKEDPITTVKRLCDSYVGYGAMNNILGEWLILAKVINEDLSLFKSSTTSLDHSQQQYNEYQRLHDKKKQEVDNMITLEIASLIKHKFHRSIADAIILQVSDIPPWLLAMMNDNILRKTLIELYNMNSDSTLLGFVLRQLSKLGYHNEIAHLIREFEYLEVFHDILIDVVTRVAKAKTLQEIEDPLHDIKKNCVGNEYLYFYTIEVLIHLENIIREKSKLISERDHIYHNLADRIHRIEQELEDQEIWKSLPPSSTLSSSMLLPKPVFCLKLIGYQSLVHRIDTLNLPQYIAGNSYKVSDIIDLFLQILSNNSINDTQSTKLFDIFNMRHDIRSEEESIRTLDHFHSIIPFIPLLQHHNVVRLLVKGLIHPKSSNHPEELGYLLSLASIHRNQHIDDSNTIIKNVTELQEQLLTTREICREILIKGIDVKDYELSEQLSSYSSTPMISFVLLNWIDYCNDSESSVIQGLQNMTADISYSTYLALVPLFYHLIIQSIQFASPTVTESSSVRSNGNSNRNYSIAYNSQVQYNFYVLKSILSKLLNSNTTNYSSELMENNNDLIQRLVRDGYECVIYIMSIGYSIIPMEYIIQTIENVDADVVRFILSTILSTVKSPISIVFFDKIIELLQSKSISKEMTRKDNFNLLLEFETEVLKGNHNISQSVDRSNMSLNALLGEDDNMNEGDVSRTESTSVEYAKLTMKLQDIIKKYKSSFKY